MPLHPSVIITVDGQPVSGLFLERLISVSITDKEGTRSDTIDLLLEAGPPFFEIPRKKAIIAAWIEKEYFGSYTADDIDLACLPYKVSIQGKSADMRDDLKEHRSRHWDDATFGQIVQEIAGENGLAAQVDQDIANYKGADGYFAQEMESGLHFIERQSRRLDGVFAIKDGKLIVAKKGAGLTPGGSAIPTLIVTPQMIIKETCHIKWTERESHKTVRAGHTNLAEAERQYEEAGSNEKGTATLTLRHQFANKDEAKRAATAYANELKRSATQTSVGIEGTPRARGGGPMAYRGVHPAVDGTKFIIETATHTFDKGSGYKVSIEAKVKVPGEASGGGSKESIANETYQGS